MTYAIIFLLLSRFMPSPQPFLWVEPTNVYVVPAPDRITRPKGITRVTPDGAYKMLDSHELLRRDNAI